MVYKVQIYELLFAEGVSLSNDKFLLPYYIYIFFLLYYFFLNKISSLKSTFLTKY
jgi:hypothetical protein